MRQLRCAPRQWSRSCDSGTGATSDLDQDGLTDHQIVRFYNQRAEASETD